MERPCEAMNETYGQGAETYAAEHPVPGEADPKALAEELVP